MYAWKHGEHISEHNAPLISAAIGIEVEIARGHLKFEEILSGESDSDIDTVQKHFTKANWYVKEILKISETHEGTIYSLENPIARKEIVDFQKDLIQFTNVITQSYKSFSGLENINYVQHTHRLMHIKLITKLNKIETVIQTVFAEEELSFRASIVFSLLFTVVVFCIAGIFLYREFSKRIKTEAQLEESERFGADILEQSLTPTVTISKQGMIQYVNPAFEKLTGFSSKELVGKSPPYPYWISETSDETNEDLKRAIIEGSTKIERQFKRKNGVRFWVEITSRPITKDGVYRYFLANLVDITTRKMAEDRIEFTNKVLKVLNDEDEEKSQISNLIDLFMEYTGMKAVGIRLREDEDYPYYETRGFPSYFVESERYLCHRNENDELLRDSLGNPVLECMCGNIISGRFDPCLPFFTKRGSFWSNSTTELLASTSDEDRQSRTRNRCNTEGYESVALIPIKEGDVTFGLLQLNDHRKDMFNPEMISFLEDAVGSIGISFGRNLARQNLLKSETHFRELFEAMPSGVLVCKAVDDGDDFVVKDFNLTGEKIDNIDREGIIDKRVTEVIPGVRELGLFEVFGRVFKTGNSEYLAPALYRDEFRPGGWRENWVYKLPSGEIVAIYNDVTERVQTQDQLRIEKDNLFSILNNMPDIVYVADSNFNLLFTNKMAQDEFGPLDGKKCYEYFGIGKEICPWCACNNPDTEDTLRWQWSSDKNQKTYDVIDTPLKNPDGTKTRLRILRDITPIKQTEKIRLQSEKLAATGRMAAGIAHEINNPLAGIKNSFLLIKDAVPRDYQYYSYIPRIENEIDRISRIVRQMFELHRPGHELVSEFDIGQTLEDVLSMLETDIRQYQVVVECHMPSTPAQVFLHKDYMIQVLYNIIKNATEASPKKGRVEITVEVSNEHLLIHTSDQGKGIDQEMGSKIFEPFFSTKGQFSREGLGLGLSVSKSMVESMGGNINVENRIEGGTIFTLDLPLKVQN